MIYWSDLSESQRIDRLRDAVALLIHRVNKIDKPEIMSGYDQVEIKQGLDSLVHYLGTDQRSSTNPEH